MLRWRFILGISFAAVLAVLLWLDHHSTEMPGVWLFPLALLVSVAAASEILGLSEARGLRPLPWVVYLGNVMVVAASWVPQVWAKDNALGRFGWPLLVFAMAVILVFVAEMRRFTVPGGVTERLSLAVLALSYVGLLLSFVVQLRMVGGGVWGIPAIVSLVIVVKFCDIGAYTVGRLIGRHRLAPGISPGKTLEGAVGGLAFACFGAWLTFFHLVPGMLPSLSQKATSPQGWGWLAFAVVVGVAGMVGDLAESLLKRDMGRKDSSSWMPGFGGVLDLVDSVLVAAPVAFLFWELGWVGGAI